MRLEALLDQYPELKGLIEDVALDRLLKNGSVQKTLGISAEQMEGLYEEGFVHYEAERYARAAQVFRWLLYLDPYVVKFWMGLGACQQMEKRFEKALEAYAMAAMLDCEDPAPHAYAYECYVALGDEENADKAKELWKSRQ